MCADVACSLLLGNDDTNLCWIASFQKVIEILTHTSTHFLRSGRAAIGEQRSAEPTKVEREFGEAGKRLLERIQEFLADLVGQLLRRDESLNELLLRGFEQIEVRLDDRVGEIV